MIENGNEEGITNSKTFIYFLMWKINIIGLERHFHVRSFEPREDIFIAAARKEFEYMIKNYLLKSCI